MKEIILTNGGVTIIDADDANKVEGASWRLYKGGYAARTGPRPNQNTIFLHRVINDTPEGLQTDHINGDRLDNRKENLRTVTCQQNQFNRKPTGSHPYKGVSWSKSNKGWRAQIYYKNKQINLGNFETPEEARIAYWEAAFYYQGKFMNEYIDFINHITGGF